MNQRKFLKCFSLTLCLCGGIILIPTVTSCSNKEVRQPSIKQSINLNIRFSDLLKNQNQVVNAYQTASQTLKTPKELFEDEFKKYPEKFIDNYDVLTKDQLDNLKIETSAKNTNDNFNSGTNNYEQWSKNSQSVPSKEKLAEESQIKKVYYPNDGSYFNVSSPKELHDKLSKQVQSLFEKLEGKTTDNKTAIYKLNDNSKIGYTSKDDLLHVNVTKTESTTSNKETTNTTSETQYDFCIPASSVFYYVKSDTLKISATKDNNKLLDLSRGVTYLNFDIGVQGQAMSENFTKDNLTINQQTISTETTNEINITSVLNALGWIKKENGNTSKENEIILDQEKIARDLNVFNVKFSNPKLFKVNGNSDSNKSYRVGLMASPTINHSWAIDGSTGQKLITTGIIKITNGSSSSEKTDKVIFDLSSQSETLAPKIIDELSKISSSKNTMTVETAKTSIETTLKSIVGDSNVSVEIVLNDFKDGKTMQTANVKITLTNVDIFNKSNILIANGNVVSLKNFVETKLASSSNETENSL